MYWCVGQNRAHCSESEVREVVGADADTPDTQQWQHCEVSKSKEGRLIPVVAKKKHAPDCSELEKHKGGTYINGI